MFIGEKNLCEMKNNTGMAEEKKEFYTPFLCEGTEEKKKEKENKEKRKIFPESLKSKSGKVKMLMR